MNRETLISPASIQPMSQRQVHITETVGGRETNIFLTKHYETNDVEKVASIKN